MPASFSKYFYFSASYAEGPRIHGHNYRLGITVNPLTPEEEAGFVRTVESRLIQKLESRDLGQDVDFLKGVTISDLNLLKIFWTRLADAVAPIRLHGMTLDKDERTRTTFIAD